MQVTELHNLAIWVQEEIETPKIVQAFEQLFNVLDANRKRQTNQEAQPFEDEKEKLLDAITTVNTNTLTLSQLHALELLQIKQNIGTDGRHRIDSILRNTLDIAHVAEQINAMKEETKKGIETAKTISHTLSPFVDNTEPELSDDQVLTRITFEREAAVNDINELRDWSSAWFDIGRGFAIANGHTPEDVRVIGGNRGSLIIELAVLATIAVPLAKAINLTLDSMVKYREYQLKAHEVRKMKEEDPRLSDEFEEDATRWEDRSTRLKKDISEEISKKLEHHFTSFRQENKAEFEKAVRTLVDFISKGGDVDCVITKDSHDETDDEDLTEIMRRLRDEFSSIRQLKEVLKLEHAPDVDDT